MKKENKTDHVTKSEFNTEIADIKTTMATKQDLKRLEEKMDAGFGLVLDRFDSFSGKQKVMDQEQLVQGLHIKELRQANLEHENRITALEKARMA